MSRQLAVFIDTSLKGICLGIADLDSSSNEFLWKFYNPSKFGSASVLTDALHTALFQLKCKAEDLRNVVVSVGPGSLTGIKVGLSWCYGLGVANPNTAYLGLSSFRELALELTRHCPENSKAKLKENRLVYWVFLPATKTTGYACRIVNTTSQIAGHHFGAKPSPQAVVHSIDTQDIFGGGPNDIWPALGDLKTVWMIGSWAELQAGLTSQGLDNETIKVYDTDEDFAFISYAALNAMLVAAKSKFPNHFSGSKPKPNYLRKSLVEERAQKYRSLQLRDKDLNSQNLTL